MTISVQGGSPTLTLSSTSYSPTVGQSYTLSGYLRDGAGNALANKPIDIFYHLVNGAWQYSNTVYTGTDGKYSTTASSSQTVYLQAGYKVGGVYVTSSNVVTITVKTGSPTLTLSSTNYNPSPGGSFIISGYLRDSTGTALAGKPIEIAYHYPGADWNYLTTANTGTDGKYIQGLYAPSTASTFYLQTGFRGDNSYTASISNVVTITVV